MKLELQVTSLELSKRLKELGVKQESLFYWKEVMDKYNVKPDLVAHGFEKYEDKKGTYINNEGDWEEKFYSAFTVAELLEDLPAQLYREKRGAQCPLTILKATPNFKGFYVEYYDLNTTDDGNLANALAKMLVYLLEQKLIILN